jgi:hypothetical protein
MREGGSNGSIGNGMHMLGHRRRLARAQSIIRPGPYFRGQGLHVIPRSH